MERRNHTRIAVNLKAALVDDQATPTGCRVRDVSKGGMLLQHEHHGNAPVFHAGDAVDVRVSLRQADESKVIPLSTTITRVEENSIGVEFVQPQSQLMKLVEPYRLDKQETLTAGSTSPVSASTSARARRRRFAIQRARVQFAETMDTAREPVAEKKQPVLERPPGEEPVTGKGSRRLFYIGLLSLLAAMSMLLLDFNNRTNLEDRMSALESAIDRQVSSLAMLRARLAPTDDHTSELSALNTRVASLATSFAALEARISQDAMQAAIPEIPATPTQTQPQSVGSGGPWVINLVSLYDQAAANQFIEKARAKDIRADTNRILVKGQQVWRVQVDGFQTRDEASAYGDTSKEKLGLNSVWIFKK
ncbi:MAG TPA: hypothetical protein ENI74_09155 [Gammaproteobacteria bacterium]|nr:hypothetical protein [Gammaproteobacteria bacterium]